MWLLIDIGNTETKFASVNEVTGKIYRLGSVSSSGKKLQSALVNTIDQHRFTRVCICSVVPGLADAARDLFRFADVPTLEVGPNIKLPFAIDYQTPDTLGTDRIAVTAGVWKLFGTERLNVLCVDAGSAVTYDLLTRDNRFAGGSIGPGPSTMMRGLTNSTDQLMKVDYHLPADAVARSTAEAIRSGIRHGFEDMVAGMIQRVTDSIEGKPLVVSTGGWGKWLAERIETIDLHEPDLLFIGMKALMEINRETVILQHPILDRLASE